MMLHQDGSRHRWIPGLEGRQGPPDPGGAGAGPARHRVHCRPRRAGAPSVYSPPSSRLPKELTLAGITTSAAANRFLDDDYLPAHNARFAVKPEAAGSAFVPDRAGAWRDILCVQEERTVGNDNTVRYHRRVLQLPPSPLRAHFVRAKVRVHHYPDDSLAAFHGPRCLARYAADGRLLDRAQVRAA
jgi:hypothetical protein